MSTSYLFTNTICLQYHGIEHKIETTRADVKLKRSRVQLKLKREAWNSKPGHFQRVTHMITDKPVMLSSS